MANLTANPNVLVISSVAHQIALEAESLGVAPYIKSASDPMGLQREINRGETAPEVESQRA